VIAQSPRPGLCKTLAGRSRRNRRRYSCGVSLTGRKLAATCGRRPPKGGCLAGRSLPNGPRAVSRLQLLVREKSTAERGRPAACSTPCAARRSCHRVRHAARLESSVRIASTPVAPSNATTDPAAPLSRAGPGSRVGPDHAYGLRRSRRPRRTGARRHHPARSRMRGWPCADPCP
jgi:hypothetical protein